MELEPIPDDEKGRELSRHLAQAEAAYVRMYEDNPKAAYSDMKESMYDAIRLARELGLTRRVAALEKTLEHRKSVFRSQMS